MLNLEKVKGFVRVNTHPKIKQKETAWSVIAEGRKMQKLQNGDKNAYQWAIQ